MLIKEPVTINNTLTLRNRIVKAPCDTAGAVDGAPDENMAEHYRQRARGTGLVIVEHEWILPEGMAHAKQLSMGDDRLIEAYRVLTEAVHCEGAAVFAQLSHAGAKAKDSGLPAIAPSENTVWPQYHPRAMDSEDFSRVTEGFAAAAQRAKAAGFDGVQIHSAHGYLLNQFYSPLTNDRTDPYSGSTLEGRTRLHCEVIRAVREAVGNDYPVAIRFGACDFMDGGSSIEEIPVAVRIFEQAGADLIDISGGLNGFMRPGNTEPGYFKDMSIAARSAVTVPVVLTGGVTTGEQLESLLEEGAADLIGVGRALLSDPDWSLKALESVCG